MQAIGQRSYEKAPPSIWEKMCHFSRRLTHYNILVVWQPYYRPVGARIKTRKSVLSSNLGSYAPTSPDHSCWSGDFGIPSTKPVFTESNVMHQPSVYQTSLFTAYTGPLMLEFMSILSTPHPDTFQIVISLTSAIVRMRRPNFTLNFNPLRIFYATW